MSTTRNTTRIYILQPRPFGWMVFWRHRWQDGRGQGAPVQDEEFVYTAPLFWQARQFVLSYPAGKCTSHLVFHEDGTATLGVTAQRWFRTATAQHGEVAG